MNQGQETTTSLRSRWSARAGRASASIMTIALAMGAVLATNEARAQASATWPNKPIRLVVPLPPGGSGDAVARLVGQALTERLGQSVVVDNKPGANMLIGASEVARSPADGYTLLLTLDTVFTVNPFAYSKLPYDPVKDFAPISLVTTQAMWFVTNPNKPAKTMKELVAKAKASPNTLNYGSGAIVGQLTGELLKVLTGAQMTYIPYKGSAPAAQALIAGDIDLTVSDITPFVPYIKEGKLIPMGQTGSTRSELLPEVPTMAEQGLKDFEVTGWFALYAPAGTPTSIVTRLNTELVKVMGTPDIKRRINEFGLEAASSSPSELNQRAIKDAARWAQIIKEANIKLD
jgi:tripartite-type tricarboxylate transporter receptor subunit TctC